jgi:hypothetical protein
VQGKPHKQIAFELAISERTVKLHRHQLVQKLQVRSLAELAVIGERLGLLPQHNGKLASDGGRIAKLVRTVSGPARHS